VYIITGSQKGQKAVARLELPAPGGWHGDFVDRSFFHRQIGFHVHVGGRGTLVAEPERDHGDIDSGLKEVHGR